MDLNLENARTRALLGIGVWILVWVILINPALNNWISQTHDYNQIPVYWAVTQAFFYLTFAAAVFWITRSLDFSTFSIGLLLVGTALFVVLSAPQCISADPQLANVFSAIPGINQFVHNSNAGAVGGRLLATPDNSMCYSGTDTLVSYGLHIVGVQYDTPTMYYATYILGVIGLFAIGALIVSETELYAYLRKMFKQG